MNGVIMKFGGTSVGNPDAINRLVSIVERQLVTQTSNLRPVVVVSALDGVTDKLLSVARLAEAGSLGDANRELQGLLERHKSVLSQVAPNSAEASHFIRQEFHDLSDMIHALAITREATPRLLDAIAAVGELLSSAIVRVVLESRGVPSCWVDARQVLTTDAYYMSATPDMEQTKRKCHERIENERKKGNVVVLGGFIGSTSEGITTTLGRGGSDYSAAIFGSCLGVDEIQIWTDVDGMMTADPRIVEKAQLLPEVSFDEASELTVFGAKVLHPSTIQPAMDNNIPVRILNSKRPEGTGTIITATRNERVNGVVTAVSRKPGVTAIRVTSTRMLGAAGFMRSMFEVFERHQTSVDVISTSRVSVSLTLDNTKKLPEIKDDLSKIGTVTVEEHQAIICVVGDKLNGTEGVAARVFTATRPANVHMISQGGSEINLTFVVKDSEADGVVRRIHEEFFGS